MNISSKTVYDKEDGVRDGVGAFERLSRLKLRIADLTNTPVYVSLAKEHVARVIPPIKKTNLILKNVNFQYAMKLWDFLQANANYGNGVTKDKKTIDKDLGVKQMLDDTFLLNYLVMTSVDNEDGILDDNAKSELVEELTNKMINKIVELNADMPVEKLEQTIGEKIAIIKNKHEATLAELEHKFNDRIDEYINRILEFSFR
jgi:hypothetical protein